MKLFIIIGFIAIAMAKLDFLENQMENY